VFRATVSKWQELYNAFPTLSIRQEYYKVNYIYRSICDNSVTAQNV